MGQDVVQTGKTIRIFPPHVQFEAVEPGVPHSTVLVVKNVDLNASHMVKISLPQSRAFRLNGIQPSLKLVRARPLPNSPLPLPPPRHLRQGD